MVYEYLNADARRVLESAGWPEHVVTAPTKAPRIIESKEDFVQELVSKSHLDTVVVLPEGVRLLGQDVALDPRVLQAATSTKTAYEALDRLGEARKDLVACVAWHAGGVHRLGAASLEMQWKDVRNRCPAKRRDTIYIAELRKKADQLVPALTKTMKEAIGTSDYLYWDDQGGGIFIGGPGAGYHLHQDSHQVSNIGTNFVGWKLFACWRHGDETLNVVESFGDTFFLPPLDAEHIRALEAASCVALVPPGSVFLFSGANAHVVLNVGSGCCCVAYESFVNVHTDHVHAVLGTHDPDVHHEDCWMDSGTQGLRTLARAIADRAEMTADVNNAIQNSSTELAALVQEELRRRRKRQHDGSPEPQRCREEHGDPPTTSDAWLASLSSKRHCGDSPLPEPLATDEQCGKTLDDPSDAWLASLK